MPTNFLRAFFILFLGFTFLVIYEIAHMYIPALSQFKTSRFLNLWIDKPEIIEEDTLINPFDDIDSLLLDSVLFNDSLAVSDSIPAVVDTATYQGKYFLKTFFEALADLRDGKRKKVRIAYYGDSSTEADIIVGPFRDSLQRRFGGLGIGYLPILAHGYLGRNTLKHRYHKGWQRNNYFKKNRHGFNYSLTGDYATSPLRDSIQNDLWLKLLAYKKYESMDTMKKVYLFYGNAQDSLHQAPSVSIVNFNDTINYTLNGKYMLNRKRVSNFPRRSLEMIFHFKNPYPIYGFSIEDDNGIYVDNLAKRGDSGAGFVKVKQSMLKAYNKHFEYDLIILQYGANVLSDQKKNYDFYQKWMERTVAHFNNAMPGVPILIIGNQDRGVKKDGEIVPSDKVPYLVSAQQKAAARCNTAFMNLYEIMGGAGSIISWADVEKPALAAKDYTHFNHFGGDRVAGYLFDYLLPEVDSIKAPPIIAIENLPVNQSKN